LVTRCPDVSYDQNIEIVIELSGNDVGLLLSPNVAYHAVIIELNVVILTCDVRLGELNFY